MSHHPISFATWWKVPVFGLVAMASCIAFQHGKYYLTTWPSDMGMEPLGWLILGFIPWCAGGLIGAIWAFKQSKNAWGWAIFGGLVLSYPLWCWLTIPLLAGVAQLVQVILRPWKT